MNINKHKIRKVGLVPFSTHLVNKEKLVNVFTQFSCSYDEELY